MNTNTHYIAIKPVCGIPVWVPDVIWEVLSEDKSVHITTETRVSVLHDALYGAVSGAIDNGEGPEDVCFCARVPMTRTHLATLRCRIEIYNDDLWIIPDSALPETRTAREQREFLEERTMLATIRSRS